MASRIWKAFAFWSGSPQLFLSASGMTMFGSLMIYSAGVLNIPSAVSQSAWIRQIAWWLLALLAFSFIRRMRVRWLEWFAYPLYGLSFFLLIVTLFFGTGSGTASGVNSFNSIKE